MATPTIKSTYTLDLETVKALEDMVKRLGVSKSEALRRAVNQAAAQLPDRRQQALDALTRLQQSVSPVQVERWARQVRVERQGSTAKRMAKLTKAVR